MNRSFKLSIISLLLFFYVSSLYIFSNSKVVKVCCFFQKLCNLFFIFLSIIHLKLKMYGVRQRLRFILFLQGCPAVKKKFLIFDLVHVLGKKKNQLTECSIYSCIICFVTLVLLCNITLISHSLDFCSFIIGLKIRYCIFQIINAHTQIYYFQIHWHIVIDHNFSQIIFGGYS